MAHKEAIEELEFQIKWLNSYLTWATKGSEERKYLFDEIKKKQEKLVELKTNKGKELSI